MLFSVQELTKVWGVAPIGVVHIGAHMAEESKDYSRFNWIPVAWFEAQTDLVIALRIMLDPTVNDVYEATLWDKNDETLVFNVTNNGQSSSLLNFGKHATDYPDIKVVEKQIKTTTRFDSLPKRVETFNFINLDVQGAELQVLQGMGSELDRADWIYTEVNKDEVYSNCVQISELDSFLRQHGFNRVATRWCFGKDWGDALYAKMSINLSLKSKLLRMKNQIRWNTFQFFVYIKGSFSSPVVERLRKTN